MEPFVTALVSTGNRQHLAPLAISCALSQTYSNFEVLVVDDGTDPTPVPVDSRLRYIRLPQRTPRLLIGGKINASVPLAQGDIIMQFDDDDWYAPTRMQDQVDLLLSSGKQVVGYHEFLFYHTIYKQAYRFRFPSPPWASGATQAYYKSWWMTHKFHVVTGCDTAFCVMARQANQLASKPSNGMLVARHHGANTWFPQLGSRQWPLVDRTELPKAFLEAIEP